MSIEQKSVKFRRLRGVTFDSNRAYQEVSNYLEVAYPKPLKAIPNGFNRVALAANALYYFDPVLMQMVKEKPDGKYLDAYNMYLRNNPNDPLGDAHEEVHAASKVINSELGNGLTDFFRIYKTLKEGDDFSCEAPAVYTCVEEGVADSVAIQISLNSKNDRRIEQAKARKAKLLQGDEGITPEHAMFAFDKSVDFMNELLSNLGIRKSKLLFDVMWLQQDLAYLVGYPFVHEATDYLVDQGLATHSQAIKTIMKTPPTTVEELKNPVRYVQRL